MTAAHAPSDVAGPGNVVPIKRAEDTWDPAELHPETIAHRWDPETQFLGALMWLTADRARPILELVRDSDIEGPLNRWALELIRALIDADQNPNPVLVVRGAVKQAPADYAPAYETCEWSPGDQGASRYHQLALHIAAAYDHVVGYDAGVLSYAREVLDDSYRRAIRAHGIRMQQMAEAMSDREDLTDYVTQLMRGDLRDIWMRTNKLDQLATA
jgi:hypothetical protein